MIVLPQLKGPPAPLEIDQILPCFQLFHLIATGATWWLYGLLWYMFMIRVLVFTQVSEFRTRSLMSLLKGIFQIFLCFLSHAAKKRSNLSPVMRLFFHGGPICVSLMTRHFYQDFAHHEVRASDRRDAGDYATRQRNKKNAGKRGVKFVKCKGKTRQQ